MRSLARGFATISIPAVALVVAACGGGGATTAPTSGAATNPPATSAPATTSAEASCHTPDASEATDVEASVAGFEWSAVTAKVGDVITWSNGDSAPHGVKTDDGSCRMEENIAGNGTGSLVFDKAGTYPITCTVHSNMKGTITIAE
jgi:plastocyanin